MREMTTFTKNYIYIYISFLTNLKKFRIYIKWVADHYNGWPAKHRMGVALPPLEGLVVDEQGPLGVAGTPLPLGVAKTTLGEISRWL
jgi:hypothetical protein